MPCNDISEILKLTLNEQSKVESYSLIKNSCGGDVGEKDMILEWLQKFTAKELIAVLPDQFIEENPARSNLREYMLMKNFLAVRSGVAILLGEESGSADDFCAVGTINYEDGNTMLTAYVKIDAITEEIKACGQRNSKS